MFLGVCADDQSEMASADALASDETTPAPRRLAHWHEARTWFQESQEIYKVFYDAGKLSCHDAARLGVVT